MHKDKKGKGILKKLKIDAFVEAKDKNYDFTRKMLKTIQALKLKNEKP